MEAPMFRAITATSSLSARRSPPHIRRCLSLRHLHTTPSKEATLVPFPTVPGPPPEPPQASVTHPPDRIARKRQQIEALRQNQQSKAQPNKPTTTLQKRFWKQVHVKETETGYEVHLDTRPVRTASRQALTVPKSKRALATAIAIEWDQLVSAQQAIKQHFIPLTSITSRAFDIKNSDAQFGLVENQIRQSIVKMALRYLGTDTLLCWAPEKNVHDPFTQQDGRRPLRQRQREVAEPIIAYLTIHVFPGIDIVPILGEDSIVPIPQPEMTREVIRGWISGLPAFELAALERGVLATKSLLVAARLLVEWSSEFAHLRRAPSEDSIIDTESDRFDIEKAAEAANLEVLHQTEQWGEVEDTHDVDKEDVRRQLGSVVLLVS